MLPCHAKGKTGIEPNDQRNQDAPAQPLGHQ